MGWISPGLDFPAFSRIRTYPTIGNSSAVFIVRSIKLLARLRPSTWFVSRPRSDTMPAVFLYERQEEEGELEIISESILQLKPTFYAQSTSRATVCPICNPQYCLRYASCWLGHYHSSWPSIKNDHNFLWDKTWSLRPCYPTRGYNPAPMTDLRPLISQNVCACKNTKMADITPPNTVHANLSCTRELFNSTLTW
jgi:hypothetical protein